MTTALVLDGMTVPIDRSGTSRRARLTIERDGSLRLRAADDVQRDELASFLRSKREWIYGKLAEKELLHSAPITKELVDGEGFLYLGRSHQLRVVNNGADRVRLERGRLVLPQDHRSDGHALIVEWYRRRGMNWLLPSLAEWAHRLRVAPGPLDVADLGYKWGAAMPDGRVRIHWATMQLRPALVDYVLAHELAHLQEPHHGPTFWALLGRVMPDYEDRRAVLARVGTNLWFGMASGGREA
jgi:predicted metal-dependent hydrolase